MSAENMIYKAGLSYDCLNPLDYEGKMISPPPSYQ